MKYQMQIRLFKERKYVSLAEHIFTRNDDRFVERECARMASADGTTDFYEAVRYKWLETVR